MMRVSILGASGKVGRYLLSEVENTNDMKLGEAISSGRGEANGAFVALGASTLENSDVLIDFSTPAATMELLDRVQGNPLPLVIGTTGFSAAESARLRSEAQNRAILVGANFTKGFEAFAAAAQDLVGSLPDAAIEVGEIYNALKKPAASGTTHRLCNELSQGNSREIGTDIQRIGDTAGTNIVTLDYGVARIRLELNVASRAAYSAGAIEAARWLVGKPNGSYEPRNLIS